MTILIPRALAQAAAAIVATLVIVLASAPGRADDGSIAPADAWLAEGGSPSRTARSLARPLGRSVETAWTATLAAPPAGEPVAAGVWAFFDVPAPAGQRTLTVLRTTDGTVVAKRQLRSDVPLAASISWPFVVVRTGPTKIGAFRLKGTQLLEMWNVDVGSAVRSVVAIDGAAFVRTDTLLARYEIGMREPTWSVPATWRGRLAVRDGEVYALRYDKDGNCSLVAHARDGGQVRASEFVGHHNGEIPPPESETTILVDSTCACVVHALGVAATSGGVLHRVDVPRTATGGSLVFGKPLFSRLPRAPLPVAGGILEPTTTDESGPVLAVSEWSSDSIRVLASKKRHGEWVGPVDLATSAGRLVYHPRGALDVTTGRIAWVPPDGADWTVRPVPLRGILLTVGKGGVVRALRGAGRGGPAAPEPVGSPSAEPADGRLVMRDGSVAVAKFRRTADGFAIEATPPRTIPEGEVLLAEDAKHRVLHAVHGPEISDALAALGDDATSAVATAAIAESLASRDPALLRDVMAFALRAGAPPSEVEKLDKRIRDLLRPGKPLPQDPAARAKLDARRREASAVPAGIARTRLAALPADATGPVVVDLLRAVLLADPADAAAAERVRALLPKDLAVPQPFDAREWLDFAEAIQHTPVEILKPVPPGTPGMTPAQREVGIQSVRWRADVVGIRSPHLLIVTSVKRPGAIARCLATGELVCSTLDGLFAGGTRRRTTNDPLLLILYPSREEYAQESARSGISTEWTAGHYSPSEELARLFLPDDDAAFEEVSRTFIHELTHQWIDQLCPYFAASERDLGSGTPGYWIVEGFATFVENLAFDTRRGRWEFDPLASPMETVAAAPAGALVPWPQLFRIDAAAFRKLDREKTFEIPYVRRLGWSGRLHETNMFYEQSAAVCAWLAMADGGARRQALLDYVAAYYRGRTPEIEAAFGLTMVQIGANAREWCAAGFR